MREGHGHGARQRAPGRCEGGGPGGKLEGGSGGREGPFRVAAEDETLNGIEERDRILEEGGFEVISGRNVKKRPAAAPSEPRQELASYRQ